jgi:hypothetical protein
MGPLRERTGWRILTFLIFIAMPGLGIMIAVASTVNRLCGFADDAVDR